MHTYMCVYVYIHGYIHICVYLYMHVYIHVCVCVYTHIPHMHTYMYIYFSMPAI